MSSDLPAAPIHDAQRALARRFSSVWLLGPPPGEGLDRLIAHLFTPDEAVLALELRPYRRRTAEEVARRTHRAVEEIRPLLEQMADRATIHGGSGGYMLLPIVPGMFEFLLMGGGDDAWYRTYAELFEGLFGTGYARAYTTTRVPAVRTVAATGTDVREIAIDRDLDTRSRVLDDDALLAILGAHTRFGVLNVCQCRQSRRMTGHRCRRAEPEDGCLIFGDFASSSIDRGRGRRIDRTEMCDLIERRREQRLVFLSGNVAPESPNVICTCCECCCHMLQLVNEWDGQRWLAPPLFRAAVDEARCDHCGLCRPACATRAHRVQRKVHTYHRDHCIGCGNCVGACPQGAIRLEPDPAYRPPSKTFERLGRRLAPAAGLALLRAHFGRGDP